VDDAHCHFLSSRFFEALGRERFGADGQMSADRVAAELGWDAAGSADALANRWVTELDRHGVSRAALISSVPGDEESVAEAVTRFPQRFIGYFALNAVAPDALVRAKHAFADLGLRCVCLFPAMHRYRLDDDRVKALFELASANGGAVFAHCGYLSIEARTRLGLRSTFDVRFGDPLALAATAISFPNVPVILPHFGGGFFREALMAAETCGNIYLDTSSSNSWIKFVPGLTLPDVFRSALSIAGPDRLLFGTDSSFFPRGWRKVIQGAQQVILDELGIEPATMQKIFSGNFERLFPTQI
jgi:predicted TIM-barrel fold metal-dependent hydrolase